jgi:hypothetical protein
MSKTCALSLLAQMPEQCPEDRCAFWQRGGADLEEGCAIQRLQLHTYGPDVADFLLDARHRLETAEG